MSLCLSRGGGVTFSSHITFASCPKSFILKTSTLQGQPGRAIAALVWLICINCAEAFCTGRGTGKLEAKNFI